ncbi:acetyl-CoA carboxylase carboxyl transferase subunit beta [Desulfitispora alkaliphila]|uniref:acetyl-CoA carboxylase, carboxyltransferase subunit beta n=1 Tax=Desulfitispora alkaliphila TaxID=622674 RepID=UPI003D19CB22
MFKNFFQRPKYATVSQKEKKEKQKKKDEDNNLSFLWTKCKDCGEIIFNKELEKNNKICYKCGYGFRLTATERINVTVDDGSFEEFNEDIEATNPLQFPGYEEKLKQEKDKTGRKEAIVTGTGTITGNKCVIAILDSHFFMGSMGTVVGEKFVLAVEKAIELGVPLVVFSASGGARMQEGLLSLMQMAKTSAALNKLTDARLPFISILTDPTTGGVSASYASLGDIIIAEQGALIGFAGPRVIEQTIRQKLPQGFQRAEFLLQHGLIDKVVARDEMKDTLGKILELHSVGG